MYVETLLGFVLLFAGGELLVRGAVGTARRLGVSPLLISMTVVAFCTSAPELFVCLSAAFRGNPDIAVGSVVGSNIVNTLGVIASAALLTPILVDARKVRVEVWAMLAASALMVGLGFVGTVGRASGIAMVAALAAYTVISYVRERGAATPEVALDLDQAEQFEAVPGELRTGLAAVGGGLAALTFGSRLLVAGATAIASSFGVPEAVIALTVVAFGTSLPELAASITAVIRGHADVAVGNVIGSNLTNVLGIVGLTAAVRPIAYSPAIARFDVWVMAAAAAGLALLLLHRGRIGRLAGGLGLGAYIAYVALAYV